MAVQPSASGAYDRDGASLAAGGELVVLVMRKRLGEIERKKRETRRDSERKGAPRERKGEKALVHTLCALEYLSRT